MLSSLGEALGGDSGARRGGAHRDRRSAAPSTRRLDEASARARPQRLSARDVEVIVVDGGSSDATRELAARRGRARARVRARSRAAARGRRPRELGRRGAAARTPTRACRAAGARRCCDALRDERVVGGAFRFRFDERSPVLRFIEFGARLRSRSVAASVRRPGAVRAAPHARGDRRHPRGARDGGSRPRAAHEARAAASRCSPRPRSPRRAATARAGRCARCCATGSRRRPGRSASTAGASRSGRAGERAPPPRRPRGSRSARPALRRLARLRAAQPPLLRGRGCVVTLGYVARLRRGADAGRLVRAARSRTGLPAAEVVRRVRVARGRHAPRARCCATSRARSCSTRRARSSTSCATTSSPTCSGCRSRFYFRWRTGDIMSRCVNDLDRGAAAAGRRAAQSAPDAGALRRA